MAIKWKGWRSLIIPRDSFVISTVVQFLLWYLHICVTIDWAHITNNNVRVLLLSDWGRLDKQYININNNLYGFLFFIHFKFLPSQTISLDFFHLYISAHAGHLNSSSASFQVFSTLTVYFHFNWLIPCLYTYSNYCKHSF